MNENKENDNTGASANNNEILQEILANRNKKPRKSWFAQDSEKKIIEKRFSQIDIASENSLTDFKEKVFMILCFFFVYFFTYLN